MKYKIIILTFSICVSSLITIETYGQHRIDISSDERNDERNHKDSLEIISKNEMRAQKTKDDNRMADAKIDRRETKAKAIDARRIERDARAAAKESRLAVKSERKAQHSRRQAINQAKKASRARDKSDNN